MKKIISFILCIILIVGTLPISAMAASATASTMRLEKYQGSVAVKNASGKTLGTSGKMRLYSGYQVTTARGSYAYISLDGSKSIKLDASSKVTIAQQGRKLEVLVNYGKLLFDVNQPLDKDETLNIRTSTMVTGVRGTIGWVEVNEKDESQLKLIEGKTTVMLVNPLSGETQTTEISSGQALSSIMQDIPGDDGITIVIDKLEEEDIPGFVSTMIAENPDMQQRIENSSTLNVSSIVDNAEEQLKQDEADAEAAAKETDNNIRQDIKEAESEKQSVSLFEKQESESITPPAPTPTPEPEPEPSPTPTPEPEPVFYSVSFDTGDLELNIDPQSVESGSYVEEPLLEDVEGYTFEGWYKDADYTEFWSFETDTVTQDTTLYAKWSLKSYTVTFEMNGHGDTIEPQTIIHGNTIIRPDEPVEDGYEFGGWYKDSKLENAWDFETDAVTQDTVIYAKWTMIPTSIALTNPTPEEFAEALAAISESAYTKELILEDADLQYGAFTLAEGTTLTVNSGTFVVTQVITINGTFNLNPGSEFINQGSIQISSDAFFNASDDANFINEGVFIDNGAKFGAEINLKYTGESGGQITELVFKGNPAYANPNLFDKNTTIHFFGAESLTMKLPYELTTENTSNDFAPRTIVFSADSGTAVALVADEDGLSVGNNVELIIEAKETSPFQFEGRIILRDGDSTNYRAYLSATRTIFNCTVGDAITVGGGGSTLALNNCTVTSTTGSAIVSYGVLTLNNSCKAYGYTYGVYSTGTLTSSSDSEFRLTKPAKELVDNKTNFAIYIVETEVNTNRILGTAYALTMGNLYNIETGVAPSDPNESDGYYSLVLKGSGT